MNNSNSSDSNISALPQTLKDKLIKHNQTHLIKLIERINNDDTRNAFIKQIEHADMQLMNELYEVYKMSPSSPGEKTFKADDIAPIEQQYSLMSFSKDEYDKILHKGYETVAQGKVGLLILAGGLGTRLGFDKAKGMFNICMPSNKTLFEYLCNRFQCNQMKSQEHITHTNTNNDIKCRNSTLFIMTSQHNHKSIVEFFTTHNYFGLSKDNVIFFPQNEICALTLNGKIITTTPTELYMAPDGNGGCFTAMKQHNIIQTCEERNISFLNVVSIDNPLYNVLDPFNVGLLLMKGKCGDDQMSAKCLKKNDPSEKIGNFLLFKNHPMMLDYMEVPNELKSLKKANGDLVYSACNILDYLISVQFVKKILHDNTKYKELIKQFHFLPKKFKHCEVSFTDNGDVVVCEENVNGLKFEIFFNSIFEFAGKDGLMLLEIEREKEFAPVKNHEGELTNTPSLTRMKMSMLFKKLYTNIGGKLLNDNDTCDSNILEFSLLINFDNETNETFFKKYPHIPREIDMSKGNVYYDYYSV